MKPQRTQKGRYTTAHGPFRKLLTALVSLFTALIGLSEALKQRSKHKKRGRRR